MSETPTLGSQYMTRQYVKANHKTYNGFKYMENILDAPKSSTDGKQHLLTHYGQPVDINYVPDVAKIPHNILAVPSRPNSDDYETFEEYEEAWNQWKIKMENFTSHYRLPRVVGSEINIPKSEGKKLTSDPWDALLVPPEPNVCDYDNYESYKGAVEKWIREVSTVGFLPPHVDEFDNAFFEKRQGFKKQEGTGTLTEDKIAEFEGFVKETMCSNFDITYDMRFCVKKPEKMEFDQNNKNRFANKLRDPAVLKKIKGLSEKMKTEDVIDGSKSLSKVYNQHINLEYLLKGNNNGEKDQPIGERLFKTNKASQIFKTIVQRSIDRKRTADKSVVTGMEQEFIDLVRSNQLNMEIVFNLFLYTTGFSDFYNILNTEIGSKKVSKILFEYIDGNVDNVQEFYNSIIYTSTNTTHMKMSLFARDMLMEDGKKLITQGLLSANLKEKMKTLFHAAYLHTYGRVDIFEYKKDVAEAMKAFIANKIVEHNSKKELNKTEISVNGLGTLVEDVFTIYYMEQIIGEEGRGINLNQHVFSLILGLTKLKGELNAFITFLPELLQREEFVPLTLFMFFQFINFFIENKIEYFMFIKDNIKAIDILPLIIRQGKKNPIKQFGYVIELFVSKILTNNEIRVEFFTKLTSKIEGLEMYTFESMLNAETDIQFIKLLIKIMRTVISEMPKIDTTEDYFGELIGESFFNAIGNKIEETFIVKIDKGNGEIEEKKDEEYNCAIVTLLKSIVKHKYIKKQLGKKAESPEQKLTISMAFVDKILKKMTESLKDKTDKKRISQKFFSKMLDFIRYTYKVTDQFYPLNSSNDNFIKTHGAIAGHLADLKEKATPKLLRSMCKMNVVVFKMINTIIPRPNPQETPQEKKENDKINARLNFFLGEGFKMIEMHLNGKVWNFINFYLKETTLTHGEIMLTYVSELLKMACEFDCEQLTDRMKKFLSQQFFTDSTALKMMKQEMENRDISERQYNTFKKGYNCIIYPSVMRVAFMISYYQHNNKIVKVSVNPTTKERIIEVVTKTGKADDTKGAILDPKESESVYNQYRNNDVNGKI